VEILLDWQGHTVAAVIAWHLAATYVQLHDNQQGAKIESLEAATKNLRVEKENRQK
jgi:hypothetical protein